ncbi:MAG: exodeoxyribonuclease VII large subunit, partial [Lentisphaerae bacterium RIFOXYA12_FULL_60_10]
MIVRAAGWQKPVSDTIPVKALTVTELTRRIRAALEQGIGPVVVEGEVSNVRRPSSGHCYFTLKDETAQIAAVLFRGVLETLRIVPKDGLQVRVRGELTVYEKNGNYQILVRHLEETGRGSLQARFEQLKSRLQQEGLFDAARKRPLPVLPRHIGIVTSPTGAAIRDILQVLSRRFPNLHVLVAPVRVQGDGAAEAIAAAIDRLNQRADLDVLIIGRGGGSLEDLWAFNEEVVARAVFRSRLPVISAVGHEIDFTISDFVADVRAPTPSAAAEIVVRA